MPSNLSAYSFDNPINLCDLGACFNVASGALTTGTLDPQTGQTRDGGYSPPPISLTYTPQEIDGTDSISLDSYLSEASTVSVNLSTLSTCVNLATGYDMFNFGYELLIRGKGQVLDRSDSYNYKNTLNIVCSSSFVTNWRILSGTATYNKMLSSSPIDRLPVGAYKRTTSPSDIVIVDYYLPTEYQAPPVFWPNEPINIYKTEKIVWDMSSIRIGGENLKNTFVPISLNEKVFIVNQTKDVPLNCDYIVASYEFLSTNGRDLDMFTSIMSKDTRQYPVSSPIGFCTVSPSENWDFAKWSGDNTLYGVESVLFGIKNYFNYFDYNDFQVRFAARWYPSGVMPGDRNTSIKIKCYSGGTMYLSGDNFYNEGGNIIAEIDTPLTYIDTKGGCGGGEEINGVEYQRFVKSNIGVMNYNKLQNKLSFTALTGKIGGSYVSTGIYNIGPDIEIPPTPTLSISAIQDVVFIKSSLLWSDGVITENLFEFPLYLPDGTNGSEGGVIHSRKFSTPGLYTILNNTVYYTDLTGEQKTIVEPYNITFVVS